MSRVKFNKNEEIYNSLVQPSCYSLEKACRSSLPASDMLGFRINNSKNDRLQQEYYYCPAVSPTGKYICLVHRYNKFRLYMEIRDTVKFEIVGNYQFDDLLKTVYVRSRTQKQSLFGDIVFLGDSHILIRMQNGYVRIIDFEKKEIWPDYHIGGCIASMAASQQYIAFSVFPGNACKMSGEEPDDYYEACGIKLFSISKTIHNKCFQLYDHIMPDKIGYLPFSMSFYDGGNLLACCGLITENNHSYSNRASIWDLNKKCSKMIINKEKSLGDISLFEAVLYSKYICIRSNKQYRFYNSSGVLTSSLSASDDWSTLDYVPYRFTLPSGTKAIAAYDGKVYCIDGQSHTITQPLSSHGWIYRLSITNNGNIILISYDLDILVLSAEFVPIRRFPEKHVMQQIKSESYDITLDGNLYVADEEGCLRIYNPFLENLIQKTSLRGNIKQIIADRFSRRIVLLTNSEAVLIYQPDSDTLTIYTSKHSGKPCDVGYCSGKIALPTHAEGILYMSGDSMPIIIIDSERRARVVESLVNNMLAIDEWNEDCSIKEIDKINIDAPIADLDEIRGWIIVALENGRILAFDPYRYQLNQQSIILDDISAKEILPEDKEHIVGLSSNNTDSIAIWSSDRLEVLKLDDKNNIKSSIQKQITNIKNVKWDTYNKRLVIAFADHLSFLTMDSREMYRLYLLSEGKHIWQVPYPEHLRENNLYHPGWFWSEDETCFDSFEVIDAKGIPLSNIDKTNYLRGYYMKTMVQNALRDYSAFCSSIENIPLSRQLPTVSLRLLMRENKK